MEMKTRILDAAERRMRAGGYADMSFRDLAADVGIRGSTVHYHFPGKELLAAATMDRYSDRVFEALETEAPMTKNPGARLSVFIELHAAAFENCEQTCLCAVLSSEAIDLPEMAAESVRNHIQRCLEWLESVAPENGDRRAFAARTFAEIQGALIVATAMQSPELLEQVLSRIPVKTALN